MKTFAIICFFITCSVDAIELNALTDGKKVFLVLSNDSSEVVQVSENFIHYRCNSDANLCVELIDSSGSTIEMLPRPIRFDPSLFGNHKLWPGMVYGVEFTINELVDDYGLSPGKYELRAVYRENGNVRTVMSNTLDLTVKEKD